MGCYSSVHGTIVFRHSVRRMFVEFNHLESVRQEGWPLPLLGTFLGFDAVQC